jgi:hypothetical protein
VISETVDEKRAIYRMPTAFGPALGPRQSPEGNPFDQAGSPRKLCVYAAFRTDADLLKATLPPGFALRGIPTVIYEFGYLSEIGWLAGRGYNLLTMRIPVRFAHGSTMIDGFFQPVVWENMADPIISGREELGWNKVFGDIPPPVRQDGKITCQAEWMGFKFMELTLKDINESSSGPLATSPVLHRKYIPATQHWGKADVDYITMTPAGGSQAKLLESFTASANLSVFAPSWQDMPTQHACVSFLARLPLHECLQAGMYSTVGGKDLWDQVRFD